MLFLFSCRRDRLSWEDVTSLASFLGEQLSNIHLLPHPPLNISSFTDIEHELSFPETYGCVATVNYKSNTAAEWGVFIRTLTKKRKNVSSRLTKWYTLFSWAPWFLVKQNCLNLKICKIYTDRKYHLVYALNLLNFWALSSLKFKWNLLIFYGIFRYRNCLSSCFSSIYKPSSDFCFTVFRLYLIHVFHLLVLPMCLPNMLVSMMNLCVSRFH